MTMAITHPKVDTLTNVKESGYAPHHRLHNFMMEIKRQLPRLEFGYEGTNASSSTCWVYDPSDYIALMQIGYGDFRIEGDGSSTYMLRSKRITNSKYHYSRDQHNMILSESLPRAMRSLKTILIPERVEAISLKDLDEIRRPLNTHVNISHSIEATARESVFMHSELLRHLVGVIDSGLYDFEDKDFVNKVLAWKAARETSSVDKNKPRHAYWVGIRELRPGVQVADVALWTDVKSRDPQKSEVKTYPLPELPEDIAGKLSMLSMLENNNFVDDVGIRMTERTYWVMR